MKRTIIILTVFTLLCGLTNAQTQRSVNVEVFGVYNLVGVSFDSRFKEDSKFGYKIGLGYGHENPTPEADLSKKRIVFGTSPVRLRQIDIINVVSVPINAYYLFGKTNHFFELGGGLVPYYVDYYTPNFVGFPAVRKNQFNYYGFLQTAYRYEASRFLLSVGLDIPVKTPGSDFSQILGIYPKLSVGYKL